MEKENAHIISKLGIFSLVDLPKEWGVKPATGKMLPMPWLSCERNQFRDVMGEQEYG